MLYFEDFYVGRVHRAKNIHTFDEEEIISFASKWDPQPFHTDRAAAQESIFSGLVACSSHILAASFGPRPNEEPTAAVSALGFKEIRMVSPARPGDTLDRLETCLLARQSNSHPDCGIINMQVEMLNQHDELVCAYESAFLVKNRPAA